LSCPISILIPANLLGLAEYKLADRTYAGLVEKLAARKFDLVTPELQANIVAFYAGPKHLPPDDIPTDQWQRVESAVNELKGAER
jgi:hypothetical protein